MRITGWKAASTANSLDAAVAACGGDPEIFFVGGADLYAQVLPRADRLYLTEIQAEYEGDAWFPAFDLGEWRETERNRQVNADGLGYDFVVYRRRQGPVASGRDPQAGTRSR
jgi:dihydrofolate reductase